MRWGVPQQSQNELSEYCIAKGSKISFHGDDRNSVIYHHCGGAGVDNADVIPTCKCFVQTLLSPNKDFCCL